MPIHMRMRKLRGPHMKKSMPFELFRTHTQPVNLLDLEARFESGAEVTLEALNAKNLATRRGIPVKVLAKGEHHQAADRPRPRLQCGRARAHRGRRGTCQTTRVGGLEHARDDPERLHSRGHPQEARVHRCAAGALPARRAHTGSRRQHRGGRRAPAELLERRDPQPAQHASPAESLARVALFALGIMPYITASIIMQPLHGRRAVARAAAEERARSARSGSRSTRAT